MAVDKSALSQFGLATELAVASMSKPNTRTSVEELPAFFARPHETLLGLVKPPVEALENARGEFSSGTAARRSLAFKGRIISAIDTKPYKALRRRLS